MAKIHITNLKLDTIIGVNDWERNTKQEVVINISIDFDASKAKISDDLNDAIDYDTLTKKIIKQVGSSKFYLLEKLCQMIVDIVLENVLVKEATVRIDKPNAVKFVDAVSIEFTQKNRIK